ncbi:class F sortase [Cellulosimicrobium marinum]|uniref:class F sortase n=1 Tax=Cellulosimicrobium marinum TaxID=1638992 RepID=UPI001E4B6603|nr:class F sortase [Cellulosimicrobium marinum]MCB7135822.1 class F sortase [Cellulosimicrobium marinum]
MTSRPATLAALAVGAALLVGGCSPSPADGSAVGGHVPAVDTAPAPTGGGGTGGADGPAPGASPPAVPVRPATDSPAPTPAGPARLVVPAVDLDMVVVPEGVDGEGRMALPDDARAAAWYRFGPAPASPAGATVVAAHVDDLDGPGPFARLRELAPGASVDVVDTAGVEHNYTVTRVEDVAKAALPLDSVFDRDGAPRLVLLTCGGEWDPQTRSYTENVVVTAERTTGA